MPKGHPVPAIVGGADVRVIEYLLIQHLVAVFLRQPGQCHRCTQRLGDRIDGMPHFFTIGIIPETGLAILLVNNAIYNHAAAADISLVVCAVKILEQEFIPFAVELHPGPSLQVGFCKTQILFNHIFR